MRLLCGIGFSQVRRKTSNVEYTLRFFSNVNAQASRFSTELFQIRPGTRARARALHEPSIRSRRGNEAEGIVHTENPPPYLGGYKFHGPNACQNEMEAPHAVGSNRVWTARLSRKSRHPSDQPWLASDGTRQTLKIPKNSFAFLFLGKTLVVYHNPKRMDTFGKNRAWPKKIRLSGKKGKLAEFDGGVIPDPWAKRVRDEEISRIDIELG